jgi:hypothetical protein
MLRTDVDRTPVPPGRNAHSLGDSDQRRAEVGKIRVITSVINDSERSNEHPGDSWYVSDGVLNVTSDENGLEASYPAGSWVRAERV